MSVVLDDLAERELDDECGNNELFDVDLLLVDVLLLDVEILP